MQKSRVLSARTLPAYDEMVPAPAGTTARWRGLSNEVEESYSFGYVNRYSFL
jgi:hypothetical protein